MQLKILNFKQATSSNDDYQLNDEELKFELKSKKKKWDKAQKNLEAAIAI